MEKAALKLQRNIDKQQEEKEARMAKHIASIPKPPDEWAASVDRTHGEPEFDTVDNPSNWLQY